MQNINSLFRIIEALFLKILINTETLFSKIRITEVKCRSKNFGLISFFFDLQRFSREKHCFDLCRGFQISEIRLYFDYP